MTGNDPTKNEFYINWCPFSGTLDSLLSICEEKQNLYLDKCLFLFHAVRNLLLLAAVHSNSKGVLLAELNDYYKYPDISPPKYDNYAYPAKYLLSYRAIYNRVDSIELICLNDPTDSENYALRAAIINEDLTVLHSAGTFGVDSQVGMNITGVEVFLIMAIKNTMYAIRRMVVDNKPFYENRNLSTQTYYAVGAIYLSRAMRTIERIIKEQELQKLKKFKDKHDRDNKLKGVGPKRKYDAEAPIYNERREALISVARYCISERINDVNAMKIIHKRSKYSKVAEWVLKELEKLKDNPELISEDYRKDLDKIKKLDGTNLYRSTIRKYIGRNWDRIYNVTA